MSRTRLPLPLIATLALSCGASDAEAPPYADPGPACPRLGERMSGVLATLERGGALRLRAAIEEGLDPHASGRLVEIASALIRALPPDVSLSQGGSPRGAFGALGGGGLPGLLSAVVRGLATSPDLQALGERIGPVLGVCNLAPMIRVVAAILRDPRLPGIIEAVRLSAQDTDTIATFRAALFATPGQRAAWPTFAVPLICLLRNTEDNLIALSQFLVPLLGDKAREPPLSDAVDGLLDLLEPGGAARLHAAQWVGCYVGRPPGPDAFSCPYPLPELSPDRDAILLRVMWDVLSAATATATATTNATAALPPTDTPTEPLDLSALPAFATFLDRLADEPHLGQAWADVLSSILLAPDIAEGLGELADLLDDGMADELLDALTAVASGCPG